MSIRPSVPSVAIACLLLSLTTASAWEPQPEDGPLTAIYIHGVTQEICHDTVGVERLPRILELLDDPGFPRRDNLVAFLAFLGGPQATAALIELLENPPAPFSAPEEDRARLLAPQALGKIAARGDARAWEYLHRMEGGATAGDRALATEVALGLAWALDARTDPSEDSSKRAAPEPGAPSTDSIIAEFDANSREHDNDLTYANHVDLPNKMTDSRLDTVLEEASLRAGRSDYSGDIGCCITVTRLGGAKSFGAAGDGLDRIDNSEELNAVLGNPVSRVKVVRAINWCGGPGFNIIGCASTPGSGMSLVRVSALSTEAILWIHEYGHNTGLPHASDSRRIMYGTDTGANRGLSQGECDSYHNPFFLANPIISDVGACTDFDADEVQDGIDNCPDVPNTNQADSDSDGTGDACEGAADTDNDGIADAEDNCPEDHNPGQEDFDADGSGDVCDSDDDNDGEPDVSDCAPFDNAVTKVAGKASALFWTAGSKTELVWTPGDQASQSNLYRGEILSAFEENASCLGDALPNPTFNDPESPAASTAFHFAATGENSCGESSPGEHSDGTERSFSPCP